MRLSLVAVALPLAMLPASAGSQEFGNVASISIVAGACGTLVVAGRDRSAGCRRGLAILTYRNGRKSFAFSGDDDMMVSFSGLRETSRGGWAKRSLDAVTVATHAEGGGVRTDATHATGSCRFSTPWTGRASLTCVAATASGPFRGVFTSNGEPPVTQSF